MQIIVGSTALAFYGLARSTPKDLDLWSDIEDSSLVGSDSHIIPTDILKLVPYGVDPDSVAPIKAYATPDAIYTIKCSHAGYPIKWEKTKLDILWLKARGCKLIPELYNALLEHWKAEHGKIFLNLKQSKDDFFNYTE